jgi:hypothetical protein
MALRGFVESQVNAAFSIIDDLKLEMTFKVKTNGGWNSSTHSVDSSIESSVVLYGVIDKTYTEAIDGGTTKLMDIMFNRQDVPDDYAQYDSVTFSGREHIVAGFADDGYTVTFTVSVR